MVNNWLKSSEYFLFGLTEVQPANVKQISELKIPVDGSSSVCSYEQILSYARAETLKAGGNAFKITSHQKPQPGNTCHQITGLILLLSPEQITAHKNKMLQELDNIVARQKFLDDSLVVSYGDTAIHSKVSKIAQFPKGDLGLMKYLSESVKYPATGVKDKITGLNVASFVVEPNGTISNIKIIHSLRQDFDNETIRVIRAMPSWTPAILNGRSVRSRYYLPVRYSIGRQKG